MLTKNIFIPSFSFRFDRNTSLKNIRMYYSVFKDISYGKKCFSSKTEIIYFIEQFLKNHSYYEVDYIVRIDGFLYSLYLSLHNRSFPSELFDLYIPNNKKIAMPFIAKKIYNSPLYYTDISCASKKTLDTFLSTYPDLLDEDFISSISSLNCFKKRKFHSPKVSFLLGFVFSFLFFSKKENIKSISLLLRDDYLKQVYIKYETSKIIDKRIYE